jgi:S-adenosylmethionine decarboxylase
MSEAHALVQLGMDLEAQESTQRTSTAQTDIQNVLSATLTQSDERYDHFIIRNGIRCAGAHLIIDLHEATQLDNLELMEKTMKECVEEAGATLLHIHLHHFQPNGGISGVAVLAESHISVHSWPEVGYAAFDVFMCGESKPELAVDVLRKAFKPKRVVVSEHLRGQGA